MIVSLGVLRRSAAASTVELVSELSEQLDRSLLPLARPRREQGTQLRLELLDELAGQSFTLGGETDQ